MVLAALSVGIGAISAGLGFAQSQQSNAAAKKAAREADRQAKQNYKDQLEYQEASDKYANWVAEINTITSNTEKNYAYWAQQVNYRQSLSYVNQLRNYEIVRSTTQLDLIRRTRAAAGADFVLQSEALSAQLMEAGMADEVSYMQYLHQSVKARAAMRGEREGNSIDRLAMDYARQAGDQRTLMDLQQGFREGQFTREQAAQVAQYVGRYTSQQEYQKQPYQDPIPPFAPLPTITMPQAPSITGGPPPTISPQTTSAFLNGATALLSGINTGLGVYQGLKGLTTGGKV